MIWLRSVAFFWVKPRIPEPEQPTSEPEPIIEEESDDIPEHIAKLINLANSVDPNTLDDDRLSSKLYLEIPSNLKSLKQLCLAIDKASYLLGVQFGTLEDVDFEDPYLKIPTSVSGKFVTPMTTYLLWDGKPYTFAEAASEIVIRLVQMVENYLHCYNDPNLYLQMSYIDRKLTGLFHEIYEDLSFISTRGR